MYVNALYISLISTIRTIKSFSNTIEVKFTSVESEKNMK